MNAQKYSWFKRYYPGELVDYYDVTFIALKENRFKSPAKNQQHWAPYVERAERVARPIKVEPKPTRPSSQSNKDYYYDRDGLKRKYDEPLPTIIPFDIGDRRSDSSVSDYSHSSDSSSSSSSSYDSGGSSDSGGGGCDCGSGGGCD